MIYEFITPSDPITFVADDDKVAIAVSILVGTGKAGCSTEKGDRLATLYLFHPDPMPEIAKSLGMELVEFVEANKPAVVESLKSFAYGGFEERRSYDDALAAITDPKKLTEFKRKHENRNRTSMSQWVKRAWQIGNHLIPSTPSI